MTKSDAQDKGKSYRKDRCTMRMIKRSKERLLRRLAVTGMETGARRAGLGLQQY